MKNSKTLKQYKKERQKLLDSRLSHTMQTIACCDDRKLTENKLYLKKCDKQLDAINAKIKDIETFINDMKKGRC